MSDFAVFTMICSGKDTAITQKVNCAKPEGIFIKFLSCLNY